MMELFPKTFSKDGEGRMPWYPSEATGLGHSSHSRQESKDLHKGTFEGIFTSEGESLGM